MTAGNADQNRLTTRCSFEVRLDTSESGTGLFVQSRSPLVPLVQRTNLRDGDNWSAISSVYCLGSSCLSRSPDAQAALSEYDRVIEALGPNSANHPFYTGTL